MPIAESLARVFSFDRVFGEEEELFQRMVENKTILDLRDN